LAARLDGVMGTVDDLSPSGLSFYGVIGQVASGQRLAVNLYLPDGPLTAQLEIRALMHARDGEQEYVHSVGGVFVALQPADVQRIEEFLYGSDAQWRINQYHESSPTPLQYLGMVEKSHKDLSPVQHWASCEVASDVADASGYLIGLAVTQPVDGRIRLLVHEELEPGRHYVIQTHSRAGLRTWHAAAGECEIIHTGLGVLRLYRMALLTTLVVPAAEELPSALAA
jgi:hypothetical protein